MIRVKKGQCSMIARQCIVCRKVYAASRTICCSPECRRRRNNDYQVINYAKKTGRKIPEHRCLTCDISLDGKSRRFKTCSILCAHIRRTEKMRQYDRKRYQENPRRKENNAEYYRKNRKQILSQQKEHRIKNHQQVIEKEREYYQNNRERIHEWARRWRGKNIEKLKDQKRQSYANNRERYRSYARNQRERQRLILRAVRELGLI